MIYKPNTTLILTDLWAAAAADKLGFEIESFSQQRDWKWKPGFRLNPGYAIKISPKNGDAPRSFVEMPTQWRITVTESGPNAAENFLPQVGDILEINEGEGVHVVTVTYTNEAGVVMVLDVPWEDTWPLNIKNHCRRIIERNGIPFPQFSEVIEL